MEGKIPKHVAIIPDGNRRWAKAKGFVPTKGHENSASRENVTGLLDAAQEIGLEYVSFWAFSSENWKRSAAEKKFIFDLLLKMVGELRDYAKNNDIKFRHIGRKDRLPKNLVGALNDFEEETKENNGLNVQLLMDYGGRDDIINAVKKCVEEGDKNVDEQSFANYLYAGEVPEPDLIIRTGGEKRLSGFFLYQSAYSELLFLDKYFPDFTSEDLKEAVSDFSSRQRRFGGD